LIPVLTFVETKLFNEADSIPGPVLKKIKEELDGKS